MKFQSIKSPGFTLMELLVVVAIIGILSAVILAATGEARQEARIIKILADLQEIEKSLIVYQLNTGETWPVGGGWPDTQAASIENLIATGGPGNIFPSFDQVMSGAPERPTNQSFYSYHNRGHEYTCVGVDAHDSGISIRVGGVGVTDVDPFITDALFPRFDQVIDNGDGPDCGRIRMGGSSQSLYYLVSPNSGDLTRGSI
jgi:prepilin-type N-terminal cleavage/methylation domain-containing protein